MEEHFAERQKHLDSIYAIIGYLLERCPNQFDDEMDARFQELIRSFDDAASEQRPSEAAANARFNDSLGYNYSIASAAIMQRTLNAVQRIDTRHRIPALSGLLRWHHRATRALFDRFFDMI